MKLFQLLIIILCLGLFIIPKQNFYAQQTEMSCCKTDSKKTDCCTHHKTSSDKQNHSKKSCNDCCKDCSFSANFHYVIHFDELLREDTHTALAQSNRFEYKNPYISFSLHQIWQPPKIG